MVDAGSWVSEKQPLWSQPLYMRWRRRQADLVGTCGSWGLGQVQEWVVKAGYVVKGMGENTGEQKRITGFHQQGILIHSLPQATAVISSVLLFLWTIKANQIPVKGSFSRPGKPLLYGWGCLFRGHKNKGTFSTDAIFPRNFLAQLLSSTHPSKPHLPWEGAWPVYQGKQWNPG